MIQTTLSVFAVVAVGCGSAFAGAEAPCRSVHADGTTVFFAGHSFLVPIGKSFDVLVEDGLTGTFQGHVFDSVLEGGSSGSPSALWDNADGSRTLVAGKLRAGPEIFALTTFAGPNSPVTDHSSVEDYSRWIDVARLDNPDVRILIALPWTSFGPLIGADESARQNLIHEQDMLGIVTQLRQDYPSNRIDFYNYGRTAALMFQRYEAGELPDVDCLVLSECSAGEVPLFNDSDPGHSGPMMKDLCAAGVFEVLYGVNAADVVLPEYESDVASILTESSDHNARLPRPPQDWDKDGRCTVFDLIEYLRDFDARDSTADVTGDGAYDARDVRLVIVAAE